jgi:hypothetical protein
LIFWEIEEAAAHVAKHLRRRRFFKKTNKNKTDRQTKEENDTSLEHFQVVEIVFSIIKRTHQLFFFCLAFWSVSH